MKKILILSGKGGTGKTTVSTAFIALSGAKAIADCDVDAPNLHLAMDMGVSPETADFRGGDKAFVDEDRCIGCGECQWHCRFEAIKVVDETAVVNEFACEGCGVCAHLCMMQAISLKPDVAGLRELYLGDGVFSTATLKMGRGNSGKLVTDVKLAMIKSAPDCELAIIDGSPGIGCPVIASVSGMDLVLVVAEPSQSGISDLKRLIKTVDSFKAKLAVCVNKYDTAPAFADKIEAFCRDEELAFVGKIPFDKQAIVAVNSGKSIVDFDCSAGVAVREIYKSVIQLL